MPGISKGYGGSDNGTLAVSTTLLARSGEYEGGMKLVARDEDDSAQRGDHREQCVLERD